MTAKTAVGPARGWLDRIERAGNALPDPVVIFLILIAVLAAVSAVAAAEGWSAVNPATGKTVIAESLLSEANLARLFVGMPETFTAFPPLGLVITVMIGAAVAERSGLFAALIGRATRRLSTRFLTPAVFLIGVLSHQASDAAYVVLIPLAAIVYAKAGRHPLAGLATAFAGISGAFAGNVIPAQFDVLILGITHAAATIVDPGHILNPLGNWWFTAALGLGLTPVVWWITDRIVEPRLGPWRHEGEAADIVDIAPGDPAAEARGLRRAGVAALLVVLLYAALTLWPGGAPLIDETATGPAREKPFFESLVAGFMLLFLLTGWAYGRATGAIRSHRDAVAMATEGMKSIAPYLIVAFVAAHFIAMFSWSNLGPVMAIKGAEGLGALELPRPALLVSLLLISLVFDLFIGSASAKWSAMAPIVVPMLMLLGTSPEMTTAAYRMGDSTINMISPSASNFVLVLVLAQRWRKDFGVGSLIALMLPYAIGIFAFGLALVAGWSALELPLGPGAPVAYELAR